MYLNIINNIRYESNRKSKKTDYSLKKKNHNLENESSQITNDSFNFLYYSVFYGELTKNWINLKH